MRAIERFWCIARRLERGRHVAYCAVAICCFCGFMIFSAAEVWAQKANTPEAPSAATASAAAATSSSTAPAPLTVQPWEYSPYRIHVWLAAAAAPEFSPAVMLDIQNDVFARAESAVGPPWILTIEPAPAALRSTLAYSPEMLTTAEIAKFQKSVLQGDKVIWVSLQSDQRAITIRARELDCHTRSWGQIKAREIRQLAALGQTVFDTILDVFCPLARIEIGEGKTCTVRVRAGGLALSDDSPTWIGKGDFLQPVFRQNDRYGEPLPNRIQVLPFTFLQVADHDPQSPSLVNCVVHSSMRSPIHGRPTSRRERWALKVRPFFPSTQLTVLSAPYVRTDPKVPLAGLEIYAKTPLLDVPKTQTDEERAAAEKSNPPEFMGTTDWRGKLTIPNQGLGMRIMYIKNGGLLLARLPMIAGLEPELVAEVPDDDPRLQAEGFVKGMNGEITDLVVQRQLMRVRVRKKIAERKFDDAKKILDEYRDLKTMHDLQRSLDQQMTRQKPSNVPGVRQRIEKLYADERELIAKYVDTDLVNQLTLELEAARKAPPPDESADKKDNVVSPEKAKKELPAALQKRE